jgi:D-galactarolactone cycloisomerase
MDLAGRAIRRVEIFAIRCPITVPVGPAPLTYTGRSAAMVRIEDGDGTVGWGETYLRTGTAAVLAESVGELIGTTPARARALHDRLARLIPDRYALSALSIAVDDLRARQLDVPATELYGGAVRDAVRSYASSGGYRDDADPETSWLGDVKAAVAAGHTACKIRIGRFAPAREMPILATVRDDVGDDVDLMVDANGGYSVPVARTVGRALGDVGVLWFEEPLIRFAGGVEYPGYELLSDLPVPIAAAEGLQTRSAFDAFLRRGGATILQPDVAICGGIGELLFVAEVAALSGRLCIPHSWGGPIQHAATQAAALLLPPAAEVDRADLPVLECDQLENPIRDGLCSDTCGPVDGFVAGSAAPGLGITVNEEWLRATASQIVASP